MNIDNASLIFMAADKESFDFIQRLKGQCLFYKNLSNLQEFLVCYQREVWVLYAIPQHFSLAMQLGRRVQLAGSSKTLVILIKK